MHAQHLSAAFCTNLITIGVTFSHAPTYQNSTLYTYKAPDTMGLEIDDYVIVITGKELKICRIREVHEIPQIDYDSNYNYKWVVGKVPNEMLDHHTALIAAEKEFIDLATQAKRLEQRTTTLANIRELLKDNPKVLERFESLANFGVTAIEHKPKVPDDG